MTYYKHDASGDESLTSRKMRTIRKKCPPAGYVFVFLREEAARQQKARLDFCSDDEIEYVCLDLLIELDEWKLALELLSEAGFISVDGFKVEIANWEAKQSEYLQRKTKKTDIVPTISGQCPDNIPTVSGEDQENIGTKSGECQEKVSSPLLSFNILRSSSPEDEKNPRNRDMALQMKWRALTGGGLIGPIVEVMRKFSDWDPDLENDLKAECPPRDRVAWADILADLRKQLGPKWAEMILAAKARLEQDPDMRKLGHVSIYYLFHISKNGEQAVSRVREWAGKKPPDQNGNGKTEWLKFRDYDIRCECEKGGICGYKRNIDDRAETVIRCDQCGKIYAAEALKKLRATA